MLDKLTPEQEAKLPEYRDAWLAIGLSTEPANRKEAERYVDMAYELAGLKPPALKIWCDSPFAGVVEAAKLKTGKDNPTKEEISGTLYDAAWGNHDASWLGFYEFFEKECGIKEASKLAGLNGVARNCGWFWPFDGAVVMTDRPCKIAKDPQGRLHSPNDAAIKYRDGTGVYMWHGVRVAKEWITDSKSLDVKTALTWQNIEQRRAAAEIIGWARILENLKARSLNKDVDPMIGELLEVDLPDAPKQKFLRVQCGTKRTFCLPVPPDMMTALQANAWTYAIDDAVSIEQFRNYATRT